MKKINLLFIVLLVLVMALGLFACNKEQGNTAPPASPGKDEPATTISISNLTGSGTEASPYLVSVVKGSEATFTPAVSKTGLEIELVVVDGEEFADVELAAGVVTVTGKKVGATNVKVGIRNSETAVFVKITVTAKPASGISFPLFESGEGTLAAPYVSTVRAGFSTTETYLITPADADDKAVVWTIGTIADGAFTAATDRGISATANADNNVLTVAAAESATIGETVVKATSGTATVYIKYTVTGASAMASWNKASFKSDWFTAGCEYNDDNESVLEMPADSDIYNKLQITADTSALIVKAKEISDDTALKVYVDETAISSIIGGASFDITTSKLKAPIYDLSSYIGQTVTIKIENAGVAAMGLASAELFKMDSAASERTTWSKAEIISDWELKGSSMYRAGTGEGFDLNTYDDEDLQYIYNNIAVTAETSRLAIKVRRFGQDSGRVASALLSANGTYLRAIGYADDTAAILDEGKSSYLVYDLSAYVGQTVRIVFALANPEIGHLVIQEMGLDAMDKTASELNSWNKDSIISDWDITYAPEYRSGIGEGFDLNTNDNDANEFIYNYKAITADNAKLFVKVRRFNQDNGNANKCLVFADGDLLIPMGYTNGHTVIADVDTSATQLVFDLTEYIGQTVRLAVMQPVPGTGHMVIMDIEMSAWEAVEASALDSWTKETFASDWNITYASDYRSGTGEGFDLNTNDADANEFIYNYVTVSADKTDFAVKVRRFNQDNDTPNALGVFVNGEILVAEGQTQGFIPIADDSIEEGTIYTFDFSEYVGETVQIVIMQPVPKTGHLVLMSAEFLAQA